MTIVIFYHLNAHIRLNHTFKVMNDDGHTSSIRDKILTINVKPGWKAGTRITFPKEGDQGPNNIPCKYSASLNRLMKSM